MEFGNIVYINVHHHWKDLKCLVIFVFLETLVDTDLKLTQFLKY